jgi:ABC-type polysaccharide/polyol phosphate export permease
MISALAQALRFPSLAFDHKDVLGAFVRRELKARYQGSLLGRLWPILQPLLQFAVFGFVFAVILGVELATEHSIVPKEWGVVFFMLSGIVPWITFAESTQRGVGVVVENANLIKKIAFPSELLPTQVVMVATVQQLIALALLVPTYLIVVLAVSGAPMADRLAVASHLAFLPVPFVLQFVFATGLAMLTASFNVFVRDIGNVVPLGLIIWQFMSPVFYRFEMVESGLANSAPWAVSVLHANPLFHLLALWRFAFCFERGVPFPGDSLLVISITAAFVFVLGLGLFRRWKGLFADEV